MLNASLGRPAALLSSGALILTALGTASPARAEVAFLTDSRPSTIAATWLSSQLVNNHLPLEDDPWAQPGITRSEPYTASIDLAQSLIAVGGHDNEVAAITADVAAHITDAVVENLDWTDQSTGTPTHYTTHKASWTAAALVLARSLPTPTNSLGGLDLRERLESLVASSPSGTTFDQIWVNDEPRDPDYSSFVADQAIVVEALSMSSSAKASAATDFLLGLQCDDGSFPAHFRYYDLGEDCDYYGPDTGATAVSLRVLAGLPTPSPAVTAAISSATSWLASRQLPDGSFIDEHNQKASPLVTADAATALDAVDDSGSAQHAAAWLRSLQIDDVPGCPSSGAAQGAIDITRLYGQSDLPVWDVNARRTITAHALPALALAPAAGGLLALSPTSGYRRSGSKVTYSLSGLAPGAQACLTAFGVRHRITADLHGGARLSLTAPSTTGSYAVTARDHSGSVRTVRTEVLGAAKLTVQAPATARKGSRAKVIVRGLRPHEKVTLNYGGVRVASGLATSAGTFIRRISVGTARGLKTVRAYGQFANRVGSDTIKIVR